ncbi:helix-turn-helix domain-containing protein [Romboutsia lituseburensis]|nr:helix-turn-helix domain-containing protein [Romboutsia lituseburensis]MCR8744427.1 helix-turn-helix domain-containing protein [Romboutsia lituseburensis]
MELNKLYYDRNENIFKLYQEGYSINEIVKIYNLS